MSWVAASASAQNASGSAEDLHLYDQLRKRGELTLRVYQALSANASMMVADRSANPRFYPLRANDVRFSLADPDQARAIPAHRSSSAGE